MRTTALLAQKIPSKAGAYRSHANLPYVKSERNAAIGWIFAAFLLFRLGYQLLQAEYASSWLDEGLVLVLGVIAPSGLMRLLRNAWGSRFVFFATAYVFTVLISSLLHSYSFERGREVFLTSFALDVKFFILFLGAYALAERGVEGGGLRRSLDLIMRALILVALVDSFQVFRDLLSGGIGFDGMPLGRRGGFYRPNGFFHHPVASAQVLLFGFIASLGLLARGSTALRIALSAFLFLVLILHISVKEIVVGCLCLTMFVLLYVRNNAVVRLVALVVAVAAIGAVIASPVGGEIANRISFYTGEEGADTVRGALYKGGFDIASDFKPIGSGAGTFGSQGSRMNGLSSLYVEYGVYGLWGATSRNSSYLLDTFWPKILGESGFLGLFFFVLALGVLVRSAFRVMSFTRAAEDFVVFASLVGVLVVSIAAPALGEEFLGSLFFVFSAIGLCRRNYLELRFPSSFGAKRAKHNRKVRRHGRSEVVNFPK